jgi:hypothetical protein
MFHVPELARDTTHPQLGSTAADGNNGAFDIESPEPGWRLALIASDGSEAPNEPDWQWEHVSIHAYRPAKPQPEGFTLASRRLALRTPTWKEMSYVKRLCWDAEDVVVQFHPRESEYVNCHPNVLHLWRPKTLAFPTPPAILVGPVSQKEVTA